MNVPVSLASASPSAAFSLTANRFASYPSALSTGYENGEWAYNTTLQLWGFTIKDITRFNTMIDHSYCSIEETHQMRGHISWFIHQHLTILLSDCY
jgi:hypothetical protein